jgi:hypothetical protein
VDGAFTKLFCEWDNAGSDRFVRNCAAYLGADMSKLDIDPPLEESDAAGMTRPTTNSIPDVRASWITVHLEMLPPPA